jgi:energy-coupling factor transport system substrate-specific component
MNGEGFVILQPSSVHFFCDVLFAFCFIICKKQFQITHAGWAMQHNNLLRILLFSLFLNVAGSIVALLLDLSVFLDSMGTIFAAVLLGPWIGAFLGLSTNIIKGFFHASHEIPFGIVNFGIGVIAGYLMIFIKDYRRPIPPLITGIILSIATPLMAAPIATYLYGGITAHGIDKFVVALLDSGQSILSSAFWGRIPYSFVDKLI